MERDDISLEPRNIPQFVDHNFEARLDQRPLPKPDEGKDAWLFLAAGFFIEALVWGFPLAFGIFQEYYSTHTSFSTSPEIAVIGTCAMVIS
jgi:hypothetical protein